MWRRNRSPWWKANPILEDLEKAIAEENLPLLKIKRDIVIKNIETLKEEL